MHRARLLSVLLFITCIVTVQAGLRGPGKFSGRVIFDRWDGCCLYSGVYITYVSEAVKEGLRERADQWVQVDASKVSQPHNPGDGLIQAFKYLGPAPPSRSTWINTHDVELTVTPIFGGDRAPRFSIQVTNRGEGEVKLFNNELAPTLFAERKPKLFSAPDGPSVAWVTRQGFVISGSGEPRMEGNMLQDGSPTWKVDRPLKANPLLKRGETQEVQITFRLPAGEYDFLAAYGANNGNGLASPLYAFDVDDNNRATFVPRGDSDTPSDR
jgi:hypothetical protein